MTNESRNGLNPQQKGAKVLCRTVCRHQNFEWIPRDISPNKIYIFHVWKLGPSLLSVGARTPRVSLWIVTLKKRGISIQLILFFYRVISFSCPLGAPKGHNTPSFKTRDGWFLFLFLFNFDFPCHFACNMLQNLLPPRICSSGFRDNHWCLMFLFAWNGNGGWMEAIFISWTIPWNGMKHAACVGK